ncbi:MAG: type I DNA topoisomerase [Dehalococcoidia bacterium]|nr:MAG: DNA topoisomerase I [Chloroflexi bacterium TMED230]RZP13234.1 MAG: type I DNA topoisomerase [Chloroflexota bacterium]
MSKNLVIVESPVKAKALQNYLGKEYSVMASYGHVRDLTTKKWGDKNSNNGYDINLDESKVNLTWAVETKSKKNINEISKFIKDKKPKSIFLASDPDREGEAISWHLADELKLLDKKNVNRVVFHEITKNAILESFNSPKKIDMDLVDGYKARRVMDRIVGFETSAPLSSAIRVGGRATGRVQGPSLLIVNNREDEIQAHQALEFWNIKVDLVNNKDELINVQLKGNKSNKNHFLYDPKKDKVIPIPDEESANILEDKLSKSEFNISSIKKNKFKSKPRAPFTTSTLQQSASSELRMAPRITMSIAQELFRGIETGSTVLNLITYMRTDSTFISNEILTSIGEYATKNYGDDYYSGTRVYSKASKNSQEAHEAIRPTDIKNSPEKIKNQLSDQQYKLYKLIWDRTLASQMTDSVSEKTVISVETKENDFLLESEYIESVFEGFKILDQKTNNDIVPKLSLGEKLILEKVHKLKNFTRPKSRFTEASLIKELESSGIGRPSTYASIMDRIQYHKAVIILRRSLYRTNVGKAMINALLPIFGDHFISLEFTSEMERNLDEIAQGKLSWEKVVCEFYENFQSKLEKLKKVGENNFSGENKEKVVDPSSAHHFTDIHCPICSGKIDLCDEEEFDQTEGLREKKHNCESVHMKWIPIKKKSPKDDGAFLACEKNYNEKGRTDHKSYLPEKCWASIGRTRKNNLEYFNESILAKK